MWDSLSSSDRVAVCSHLERRYNACLSHHFSHGVMEGDVNAVTRNCGALFADLSERCVRVLGEARVAAAGRGQQQQQQPGAAARAE